MPHGKNLCRVMLCAVVPGVHGVSMEYINGPPHHHGIPTTGQSMQIQSSLICMWFSPYR